MWVYGDHARQVAAGDALAQVMAMATRLRAEPRGLPWHEGCTALLIALGVLLQGVADRDMEENGADGPTPAQKALTAALLAVAGAMRRSWRSAMAEQVAPPLPMLGSLALDGTVLLKQPEGYAHYALYPEAYAAAAAAVPPGAMVIGLRSIGTGLAATVAEACGASAMLTVRPQGDPFARTVAAGEALQAAVRAAVGRPFALVDEGPGLSGSSLGGAADWLEGLGVPGDRIAFLPGHGSPLGPQASERHRRRWAQALRPSVGFDALFLAADSPVPLPRWFEDLTGPAIAPLRDLSGGAWARGETLPCDPGREARKFRLETARGRFRLKFAGLGEAGAGKLARAQALHRAGFAPRALALRHGFLLEEELAAPRARSVPVERLGDYLAFRAAEFPAASAGAPLGELVAMAAHNLAEAGVTGDLAPVAARWARAATALEGDCRPVHVDARLHRWEWLEVAGRAVKTDALDHAQGHDLVGCQDIAWDVAGAIVEHDLAPDEAALLVRRVLRGRRDAGALTRLMLFCYTGFQAGWWAMASSQHGRQRSGFYVEKAARPLAAPPSADAAWPAPAARL